MKRFFLFLLACIAGLIFIYGNLWDTPSIAYNREIQFKSHPRLFVNSYAQFESVKENIEREPEVNLWYRKILKQGLAILKQPPLEYKLPDGVRLLPVSRIVLQRVSILAFLYRMEGNHQYKDRAWAEIESAGKFESWHPEHFLDTAEMTFAFALGYDWLYDDWTLEQRKFIRDAIKTKGLEPAVKEYEKMSIGKGWANSHSNWNLVCNGGIGLGLLAIGDEEQDLTRILFPKVLQSLPKAIKTYQPDGAWSEGLGYWHYGTSYLCWLLASMQIAFGTIFNLDNTGLEVTGYFPIYLSGQGNSGFHFGDSSSERGAISGPQLFWLGRQYNRPEYIAWRKRELVTKTPTIWDILWYDPQLSGKSYIELPLDHYFKGVEVATFRTSWIDKDGFYIAIKGFGGDRSHSDLDCGDFVLDFQGIQWIEELGPDNYNLPGYGDIKTPLLGRWNYYRKRAEGQNTLVIGSSPEGPDQNPLGKSPITDFNSFTDEGVAIVDMTEAYSPNAKDIRRGIKLFGLRKTVLLQDEIHLLQPNDIWWFIHTRQKINISADGKSAQLVAGSKMLRISMLSPADGDAKFIVLDAVPLPTSPKPTQSNNAEFKKLAIHLVSQEKVTIAVLFSLDEPDKDKTNLIIPLEKW